MADSKATAIAKAERDLLEAALMLHASRREADDHITPSDFVDTMLGKAVTNLRNAQNA